MCVTVECVCVCVCTTNQQVGQLYVKLRPTILAFLIPVRLSRNDLETMFIYCEDG